MRHIGAIPGLRMLMAKAVRRRRLAALSIPVHRIHLGRDCPNLTGVDSARWGDAGLRGLAVSCKNVDGDSLSWLPRFLR